MDITRLKTVAPYIVLLLMAAFAIPLFFSAGWFADLPAIAVYTGPLGFSGERALEDVCTLATEYPGRVTGTRAARLSAEWVEERFRKMGLEARTEEFSCLSPEPSVRQDKRAGTPVSYLTYTTTGYNVAAVSPGRLSGVAVIGAHRDVAGDYQGAEDNASGTASLLELARVLSATDHEYTYVFVSYDGEEKGLRGSEAFLASNPDLDIVLAISLDMTGFSEANTVGYYPFVSNRSASPLWTQAMARAVSRTRDLPVFQFGATEETSLNPVVTFWRTRRERLTSRVPTDTGPFVDRGIPSLGVLAVHLAKERGVHAVIHGPRDTIEQVSADTLEMTGRFVEQYLKSMPVNSTRDSLSSRTYFVSEGKVLTPPALHGFTAYTGAIVAALAVLSWRDSAGRYGLQAFIRFLRADWLYIVLSLAVAAVSAAFPVVVRSGLGKSFTIISFNILWALLTVLGTTVVAAFRQRVLNRTARPYHEVTAGQKALLNLTFTLSFAALLLLSGPFVALGATVFPVLVLARVDFRSQASRALWRMAAAVWIAVGFFGMRGRVSSAAFHPVVARSLTADFARITAWVIAAVFLFTSPPRGLQAEDNLG